jgi:TRAP-type C4-dicarboxylate transport system substrate-binding protein
MVKKLVFTTLILAIVALPLFAACETTPEIISLTVNDHNPAESPPGQSLDVWAAWVEEQSGGRMDLTVHHGQALLTGEEAFRGTETGVVDIAHYALDRQDGFILNGVVTLPFMGLPDQRTTGQLYWQLMDEFREMRDEWGDVKPIGAMMMPGTHIHNNKRDVVTPDDLKGLQLHCAEAMNARAAEAAGATSVEIDIADMAMSLNTGLIDGVLNHFPVTFVFGALEFLTHHTIFGDGGINMTPMFVIMNQDVFDDLPRDMRDIMEASGQIWHDTFLEADLGFQGFTMGQAQEMGHSFIQLTPEQIAVFFNLVKGPVHDGWLAECDSEGLPGQEVYDRLKELTQ